MTARRPASVAVIGAGMAGLACARRLADAGLAVSVFDKGRRPGGRVATRETEHGGFDHGAQFFTARDPEFLRVLAPLRAEGVIRPWAAPGRAEPVWVGVPGMAALPLSLARGLDVRCGVTVSRVEGAPRRWRLRDLDGDEQGPFHAVLLTPPAPQLAALWPGDAPEALAGIAYQPCWTLLLHRPDTAPLPSVRTDPAVIAWVAHEQDKPGRGGGARCTVQASAEWSSAWLEAEPPLVQAALLAALADAWGPGVHEWSVAAVHRWRYALAQRCAPGPIWQPENWLGAAGDGLAAPRVEAAWLSGWALAGKVLETLSAP